MVLLEGLTAFGKSVGSFGKNFSFGSLAGIVLIYMIIRVKSMINKTRFWQRN